MSDYHRIRNTSNDILAIMTILHEAGYTIVNSIDQDDGSVCHLISPELSGHHTEFKLFLKTSS